MWYQSSHDDDDDDDPWTYFFFFFFESRLNTDDDDDRRPLRPSVPNRTMATVWWDVEDDHDDEWGCHCHYYHWW